jgi:glutamyl-tRNA reductase
VTLLSVGVSHKTAPLAVRERVALTERPMATLLLSLVEQEAVEEAAALSTCNRTELYLVVGDAGDAERAAVTCLAHAGRMDPADLDPAARTLRGADAARHLFRVAAGLDSMVLGEAEIQGQVRRAYARGLSLGTSGRIINRLFQDALRTGKRVRSETRICGNGASVASVALEIARCELGELRGRRALVIGAGKQGRLTARALRDAGVRTEFTASRTQPLADELARCDLVFTSTSSPRSVVTCRDLASAARGRTLVIVDTAVPRDVEPSARSLAGIRLYDLDDIQRQIARNLSVRKEEARRAEPIIDEELARFERWLASLEVLPTISELRERGRAAADRALRAHEPRWESLSDDDRERVGRIAHGVVRELLHEPTLTLRRAGERGAASLYVETVRELFGLSVSSDPSPADGHGGVARRASR